MLCFEKKTKETKRNFFFEKKILKMKIALSCCGKKSFLTKKHVRKDFFPKHVFAHFDVLESLVDLSF